MIMEDFSFLDEDTWVCYKPKTKEPTDRRDDLERPDEPGGERCFGEGHLFQ